MKRFTTLLNILKVKHSLKRLVYLFTVLLLFLICPLHSIAQKYSISGYVKYDNADSTPMTNTWVYLTNGEGIIIDSSLTTVTGYYEFVNLSNGTYKLSCSTTKPWAGVNAVDVLLIYRTYISMFTLTDTIKRHAADVNNNGKIDPIDGLMLQRRLIGIINKFNIPDWLFINLSVTTNGKNVSNNIITICAGDVNGSYYPPL